jgi:nicotinamidase/pyrazinamidase
VVKQALLVVDLQNDFLPSGALPVAAGDEIVPAVNRLMEHFDVVLATKDWHPAGHGSFAANHPGTKPGQVIRLNGIDQILWPVHCVQHTFGSEFAPELNATRFQEIFYKGADPGIDSYSGFFDNGHRRSTGLDRYLREKDINSVCITGLATDYCVKFTALDALALGFHTTVVTDAVRGIDLAPGDVGQALEEIQEKGGKLLTSEALIKYSRRMPDQRP